MGNVNEKSIPRDRTKTGSQDLLPGSPLKGQAFSFDKKPIPSHQSSTEEKEDENLSRSMPSAEPEIPAEFEQEQRPRSNTLGDGISDDSISKKTTLREYFKDFLRINYVLF